MLIDIYINRYQFLKGERKEGKKEKKRRIKGRKIYALVEVRKGLPSQALP